MDKNTTRIAKYLGESQTRSDETLHESRGGYLMNLLGELEEAFNADAGFYNGKYQPTVEQHPAIYLSKQQHQAMLKALKSLSTAMQKGYKGKLIGF